MTMDLKHWLPLFVCAAALIVVLAAGVGAGRRLIAAQYPSLMEAAYFLAACGLLLWGVR